MRDDCHQNPRPQHPRWKSLAQLAELWGLSRGRTLAVLHGLVRSGRMEVRTLCRDEGEGCEYRVVQRG